MVKAKKRYPLPHRTKYKGATSDNTQIYCPHCDTFYNRKEMWQGLARTYRNTRVIAEAIGLHQTFVWIHIVKYRLVYELDRTYAQNRPDWREVAKLVGYDNPRSLFYTLRVRKGYSWEWIAKFLGVANDEELRLAARAYLSGEEE